MSTTANVVRDDEVSKRMFYSGMFGLPWLWIVHTMGWYSKPKPEAAGDSPETMEIARQEEQWVMRCRNAAVAVTVAWIAWILLAQVLLTDLLPASWFVRYQDEGEYTGW